MIKLGMSYAGPFPGPPKAIFRQMTTQSAVMEISIVVVVETQLSCQMRHCPDSHHCSEVSQATPILVAYITPQPPFNGPPMTLFVISGALKEAWHEPSKTLLMAVGLRCLLGTNRESPSNQNLSSE